MAQVGEQGSTASIACTNFAHVDGQTQTASAPGRHVGGDAGSAAQCGPPVLPTLESRARRGAVRYVRRRRVRHVLRRGDGPAQSRPGRYFRLLLLGYFEGLDSERAIAWRAADSLSVRSFWSWSCRNPRRIYSTISRTRRLIDLETHRAVFTWVLQRLADAGLVKGTTIGIDATTLEANAALRSIVRRDTGETYQEFLTQLAQASGIETPTRDDLARLDRKRKKKGSNDDWTHPDDPDAKITKMKDHRTHLAHKAEHAVDLETGAVVGVTVQDADAGDTTTSIETLIEAAEQVEAVAPDGEGVQEVVGDKGYHSNQVMVDLEAIGIRSYISEPDRGRRKWDEHPEARGPVYRNRRRIRGARETAAPTSRRTSGTPVCASL